MVKFSGQRCTLIDQYLIIYLAWLLDIIFSQIAELFLDVVRSTNVSRRTFPGYIDVQTGDGGLSLEAIGNLTVIQFRCPLVGHVYQPLLKNSDP
jgi:hypothetical protein